MKKTITIIILVLSLAFAGCATTSPLKSGEKLDPGMGAIVVSVTANDSQGIYDAWYYFRKAGEENVQRLDAFGLGYLKKPNDFKNELDREGRLLVIPLEPGEYELTNWTLYVPRAGGYGYISPSEELPPLPFSVEPGQVTYLGNLHIKSSFGRNMFGIKMVFGGEPDIRDRSEIDLQLFKERHPGLSGSEISIQVPDVSEWTDVEESDKPD